MTRYFDAHCHLSDTPELPFDPSKFAGVICNATNVSQWHDIVTMTRARPNVFGAIGIHPWEIDTANSDWADILYRTLAATPGLMVGEIGLDKNYPDIPTQQHVFRQHLNIASRLSRIVHIHCVGAWDCMFATLNSLEKLPPAILFHGYSGGAPQIKMLSERYNAYFSYGPRALRGGVRSVARIINTPRSRLLTESDSCTPDIVIDVTNKIADILNLDTGHLADIICQNSQRMLANG